jgi:hypothetical protein
MVGAGVPGGVSEPWPKAETLKQGEAAVTKKQSG